MCKNIAAIDEWSGKRGSDEGGNCAHRVDFKVVGMEVLGCHCGGRLEWNFEGRERLTEIDFLDLDFIFGEALFC